MELATKQVPPLSGTPPTTLSDAASNAWVGQIATSVYLNAQPGNSDPFGMTLPFPDVFGTAPTQKNSVNIGYYPDAGLVPAGVFEEFVSKLTVPAAYTQTPWPNTNFSAYLDNSNPSAGGAGVNYFGIATQQGTLGGAWFANGVLSNTDPAHAISGASLGNDFSTLIGLEINHNVWKKPGALTPTGVADGIRLIGGGEVVPSGGAFGIHAYHFASGLKWSAVLYGEDASATNFINIGADSTVAASVPSMAIAFRGYDSGSSPVAGTIYLDASQYFRTASPVGFGVQANSFNIANIDSAKAAFLHPILAGSLTQSLDANAIGMFHVTADQNLEIRGKVNLADGIVIESLNDALNAVKGMELIADTLRFSSTAISVNGTAGATFTGATTGSFQVINGIVVHQ